MAENNTAAGQPYENIGLIDFFLIPAYAVVIIIGFVGNVLVIAVIKTKRPMHTTTNYLLANLAVADLLTLLWCIPGLVMRYVAHPSGVLGDYLCKFVTMHHVAGITQLVSGLTLTVLAVERYKALFHPMELRFRLTKKNVKYPIAAMWVFSIAYVVPLFVFERYNTQLKYCTIDWTDELDTFVSSMIYWGILASVVVISFATILFCYFNIIKGLYFSKTICSRGSAGSSGMAKNGSIDYDKIEKQRIVKILLSVTVAFFVCFLPFCVMSMITVTGGAVIYQLSYFLVYCSSSINPIIYAFHSSNYREAFNGILINIGEKFHCHVPKKWKHRCGSKTSDFELRATYHASESINGQQKQQQQQHAKLLSFKKLEND